MAAADDSGAQAKAEEDMMCRVMMSCCATQTKKKINATLAVENHDFSFRRSLESSDKDTSDRKEDKVLRVPDRIGQSVPLLPTTLTVIPVPLSMPFDMSWGSNVQVANSVSIYTTAVQYGRDSGDGVLRLARTPVTRQWCLLCCVAADNCTGTGAVTFTPLNAHNRTLRVAERCARND